jgi:hypothetical protein
MRTFAAAWGRNPEPQMHKLYFALTEKTSEISSGIVRFKKQRESHEMVLPDYKLAMHTPLAWSILIRSQGFQSEVCPSGKCIRVATPFFCPYICSCLILLSNQLIKNKTNEKKEFNDDMGNNNIDCSVWYCCHIL